MLNMLEINLKIYLIVLSTLLHIVFSKETCETNSCHPTKDNFINVHIIAHTHDDVGWTKTVDQYYNGEHSMSPVSVKKIIKSSLEALRKNPNRRFMYVESAFLFKWWSKQNSEIKKQFKHVVNSGQLELVSGGWSMNDEAVTNYQSIIDQFTLGLSKINDTFGACGRPRIGWQIDPFGHSNEMASIFAQLGFDGLFLGRIDYQDQEHRFKTKNAEMIWQGSKALGKKSQIFTTVLYNTYWPPEGFCVDLLCGLSNVDNLEETWRTLVKFMEHHAKVYKTNNIILTMGGDFHFTVAEVNFRRLDKLIKYGNSKQKHGSKFHFIYSTPSCYLKAVQKEAVKKDIKWPLVVHDFLPYASNSKRYWTGFYTSRPTLKRFERMGNNFLQVCKQLSVLANIKNLEKMDSLKEAMGVLQHHDAITGTEQQHVAHDYSKILTKGLNDCSNVTTDSLNKLVMTNPLDVHNLPDFKFKSCLLANISQCRLTELSENFVITIYNPLSRPVDYHVRVPVTKAVYSVRGPNGTIPIIQMVPIPESVFKIPGRQSKATMELVFTAFQIPSLGFKSYYIRKNPKDKTFIPKTCNNEKKLAVNLCDKTGFLREIILNNKSISIQQKFLYYEGVSSYTDSDGAYVFRPKHQDATTISNEAQVKIYNGPLLTEIHQIFNEWVSQVIKVYHNENYVELQWLVGPLPHGKHWSSKEIISRFTTNLKSNSTFFTDSNGREMLKRIRNARPTFKLKLTEPTASNYYPVTSKILIRDCKKGLEVAVLTDRSQGGSSLEDGQIELMVHRNSLTDDGLGVQEPLKEHAFGKPLVVRGSHYLVIGPSCNSKNETLGAIEKNLAQRKLLEAWTFVSPTKISYHDYQILYKLEYSALNSALPKNVQILTLEPWKTNNNNLLLRLEHVFEKNQDLRWSEPATINIKNLFKAFKIVNLRETTLGGNQWLDENKPMSFVGLDDSKCNISRSTKNKISKFVINLAPMQIRTFVMQIQRNN